MPEQSERAASLRPFRLGEWWVEPSLNQLSRETEAVQLEPRAMDLLEFLARFPGEVLSQRTLIDGVWAEQFVGEAVLRNTVAALRSALGDDARRPTYIQTVSKRGYRLIAPISFDEGRDAAGAEHLPSRPGRLEGVERAGPYPGLATFTESDAEVFFGRENEVEAIWHRIREQHVVGIIGPSGAGKSSLIRAGVVPHAPTGWGIVVSTPGAAPFTSLAKALTPEIDRDVESVHRLLDFGDPQVALEVVARWRSSRTEAVLVVDQLEELFTLNPPDEQARFANLLGDLLQVARVRLLLSIRDDFLMRCHDLESLAPVFACLVPLSAPAGPALRRAVVAPAASRGYRFEDEALVDEMLAEVEGERGALPLLAFAVARVWDQRDRTNHLLTRDACRRIGGVGGALAQHAEETLRAIGHDRLPVLRELFRNLVTAEGTRAVRDVDELLSVFDSMRPSASRRARNARARGDPSTRSPGSPAQDDGSGGAQVDRRGAAEEVLRTLVDARLLTSYQVHDEGERPTRRVEIVHESLLAAWPRLVRWQTQDADAARLRDELRQAARVWEEHERAPDYLWSGRAYREFALWRETYPGGLSELEEAYAQAITSHARRRRRRRRVAATAAGLLLVVVAAVFGTLWRRSARDALRAEAARLRSLAQLQTSSSLQLAYAMASLELRDDLETRLFCVRALWREPTEIRMPESTADMAFSPDGRWTAVAHQDRGVELWPRDGGEPFTLEGSAGCGGTKGLDWIRYVWFSPGSDRVAAYCGTDLPREKQEVRVWSVAAGVEPMRVDLSPIADLKVFIRGFGPAGDDLIVAGSEQRVGGLHVSWGRLPVQGGEPLSLGELDLPCPRCLAVLALNHPAAAFSPDGHAIYFASLGTRARLVGRQESQFAELALSPDARWIVSSDYQSVPRIWSTTPAEQPYQSLSGGSSGSTVRVTTFSPDGALLAGGRLEGQVLVWVLSGPPDADPVDLGKLATWGRAFDPTSRWLVLKPQEGFSLRPLRSGSPFVLHSPDPNVLGLVFDRGGDHLVSADLGASLYRWPLRGDSGDRLEVLFSKSNAFGVGLIPRFHRLALDPKGRFLAAGGILTSRRNATNAFGVTLVPLDGRSARGLEGSEDWMTFDVAFDAEGRRLAAGHYFDPEVRIWDLDGGEMSRFELEEPPRPGDVIYPTISSLRFLPGGSLLISTLSGRLWRLDPATGERERLSDEVGIFDLSRDGRHLVSCFKGRFAFHDLLEGTVRALTTHDAAQCGAVALNPAGTVVVSAGGTPDATQLGTLRVGPVTGEEPQLLFGHDARVWTLAVSPGGDRFASASFDGTIRLWRMPDVSRPALQTLPRDELLARLRAFTSARVVPDDAAPEGYRVQWAPLTRWPRHPDD